MSLLTNVATNLLTHIVDLMTHSWNLLMALFSFNFYNIGKLSGEILMMVIE